MRTDLFVFRNLLLVFIDDVLDEVVESAELFSFVRILLLRDPRQHLAGSLPEICEVPGAAEFPNAKEQDGAPCDGVSGTVRQSLRGERNASLVQVLRCRARA